MGSIRRLDCVTAVHWLAIWLVEIVVEAVGTSVVMVATILFSKYREHLLLPGDVGGAPKSIPALALLVLLYFGLTGYLITTAIASVTLRERSRWVYPSATALLYVAHSTLLFAAFGNGLLVGRNNVIQLFGAATAFGCAYFGKTVLRSWNPDVPQLAES
jgi:hypothetical protein